MVGAQAAMKLAFWKSGKRKRAPARSAAAPARDFDAAGDEDADARHIHVLRVRARRRLIGAAALLLLVVILVPMLLDPAPRAIPDNIPIDLPSERTPFTPTMSAPAEPAAAPAEASAAPAAPGSAADAGAPGGDVPAAPVAARAGRIYVQAAALARESAARDLASSLRKSGLVPFVERTDGSAGTRYRVRLGPFATRDEAEHARARLHALGVSANIVGT
jgi:DedD protein